MHGRAGQTDGGTDEGLHECRQRGAQAARALTRAPISSRAAGEFVIRRDLPAAGRLSGGDRAVIEDLVFFDAWDRGLLRGLSAMFRARQIRQANSLVDVGGVQGGR